MKISARQLTIFLLIIIINLAELLSPYIRYLKYWDELLMVFFLFYLMGTSINFKLNSLNGRTILLLLLFLFIGLTGNIVSGMQKEKVAIVLDIVANFKVPIIAIGFCYMVNSTDTRRVLYYLKNIAKIFILCGFVCMLLNQFIDFGMRGQSRYGIYSFNFIYEYAHIFSMVILSSILVVSYTNNKKSFWKWYSMGAVQLLMTLKGISIVTVAASLLILWVMKHKNKINIRTIIVLVIIGIILGQYQINEYFLGNQNAPRVMLLIYGFKTMCKYMPIGAGFATFGSDMANKYYSDLYYNYAFHENWGTRVGSQYLNDSWWPMVMGQFGIVGLIITIFVFYKIFVYLQKNKIKYYSKAMVLTGMIYLLVASLGTSIFTTSATIILIFNMLLLIRADVITKEDNSLIKEMRCCK